VILKTDKDDMAMGQNHRPEEGQEAVHHPAKLAGDGLAENTTTEGGKD